MPLYLLDANVLITAKNEYYPRHRVPEFWDWLAHVSAQGLVKMPEECFEEVAEGKDDWLADWAKSHKEALVLDEQVDPAIVAKVTDDGYAPDLTDDEVEKIGRDPFPVAYAMAMPDRCVVTTEVSRPGRRRANRKLPNVCETMGVKWAHTFAMLDALKFTTGWKPPAVV